MDEENKVDAVEIDAENVTVDAPAKAEEETAGEEEAVA